MPAYRINGHNVLFIHVPKTGGTSIESYLSGHAAMSLHNRAKRLFRLKDGTLLNRPLPMQHFHARILERMFAPEFFDYAFMVVRDPLDRLKSEYRHSATHLSRIDARLPFGMWARLMLRLTRLSPGQRHNHFRPQSDFVCFNAEVFRFEDGIGHALATVSERLGLPAPDQIPHERRLAGGDFEVSPSVATAVRAAYAEDCERFGYDGAATR